jgi:pimeloyl-ACP methyl ester carboxylesterase
MQLDTLLSLLKLTAYLIGGGLLFLIVFIYLPLYLFQNSLIFIGAKVDDGFLNQIRQQFSEVQELTLTRSEQVQLHGWYQPCQHSQHKTACPVLIYFGGNAEDVSTALPALRQYRDWAILLVNYRGYGLSSGQPSESALYQDALAIYDYVQQQPTVNPQHIVVMGRSLGTGVAVYLAQQRPVSGVILVSPYPSLVTIAQAHYPIVPVHWLLTSRFDSLQRAPEIQAPALAILAEFDEIIAVSHSRTLLAQWGGPVTTVLVPRTNHNNLSEPVLYWQSIQTFLAENKPLPMQVHHE